MSMQYVKCKFRPADTRPYTYEWSGDPLAPGDMVKVADARSDGCKRVTVVEVTDDPPTFACKPILGRADEPDAANELFPAGIADQ